jgi:hypothetical protein
METSLEGFDYHCRYLLYCSLSPVSLMREYCLSFGSSQKERDDRHDKTILTEQQPDLGCISNWPVRLFSYDNILRAYVSCFQQALDHV